MENKNNNNLDSEQETTNSQPSAKCRYCKQDILLGASVCNKCGRHQNWLLAHLELGSVLVAGALVVLSLFQYIETRKDRIEAEEALARAEKAEKKGQELSVLIEQAHTTLTNIQEASEFNSMLLRANNDDRAAFNRLVIISRNKGPFQDMAARAIEQIIDELSKSFAMLLSPHDKWKSLGVDLNSSTMEQLSSAYPSVRPRHKPSYLNEIWSQSRFSKVKRLQFLYDVIKYDKSLNAVNYACALMDDEAKLNRNILGAQDYLNWWDDNKSKYIETRENP